MKRNGMMWLVLAWALAAVKASPASGQKVTEERIHSLIREAAARAGITDLANDGAGQTPAQPVPSGGLGSATAPKVQMTLDDAIKLALDRNLDIAVQRLNPQTFDYSIANLQATYRPTLTSTINRVS